VCVLGLGFRQVLGRCNVSALGCALQVALCALQVAL